MSAGSADGGAPAPPTLILAAGKGTRLGELGAATPKVLLPIGDRPLLDRHLDHLASQRVERVFINAHHLSDAIVEHIAGYAGPLRIEVLVEDELLGTAGAAINAAAAIGDQRFIVLYGDVVMFECLDELLATHEACRATATLAVYEHSHTAAKGVVDADERGLIHAFREKDPNRTGPGLVNAGLYVIEPELLAAWPPATFLDFGHDVFPAALRSGMRLAAHRIAQPVLDIGTYDDLAQARARERDG